jgi:predicted dehydrogenase/threonine dehydrogenase-like Zn-dependent dehydrogenase
MKQVLIKSGSAHVVEVMVPQLETGEVLVRVQVSCLSIGTELSGLRGSAVPLWKKALAQPEKVATVMNMAASQGLRRTWNLIREKTDAFYATGYSAAGIVVAVGSNVQDLPIGARVACSGAQYAHHAEYIRVPRNLCTPIPDEVDFESACTVTLGAIALQGVRRAQPTLGETFVVVGLGILGQLTVQMLRANGCRVIGIDPDRSRIATATTFGMEHGQHPDDADFETVARLTDGYGADGVIITAASPSDAVVSSAFKMCRKKGRVVLVGDVGLNLNRADFYAKEIDFLISTSYGPGRYDQSYEEGGMDYPISYVRWTENRNMAEYLRLIAAGRVLVAPMVAARYPIEDATSAYNAISGSNKPLVALLTYPADVIKAAPRRSLTHKTKPSAGIGKIRIAVVGAGGFARSAHLPNLQSLADRFELRAVVTRSGQSAKAVADQFGASYCSTDYQEVLDDPDVDAVLIATRHSLHGTMALAALKAGKHVLVEKPLTLTVAEVEALDSFITGSAAESLPQLLTGYNRRFSAYARRMAELLKDRSGPFMLNYRMNAGHIPMDHWVHGAEGGGRNLGEACHIYDLFTFLADSAIKEVSAHAISPHSHYYGRSDNFVVTASFGDGSVACLTYTSLGHKDYPKETADLYVDGKLAVMTDYIRLDLYGTKTPPMTTRVQDKGLKEELIAFSDAITQGTWAIPWWQQLQTTRLALTIQEQIISSQ